MFIPIPQSLMQNSATLKKVTGKDAFGKPTYSTKALTYIRAREKTELKRTNTNDTIMLNAKFWYDLNTSKPSGVTFAVDDVITYNSKDYTIKFISVAKDYSDHHIRLECI